MSNVLAAIPSWIQAGAALSIVGLTGWTLKVLRDYAADTKRIANDSATQAERAQMPFLGLGSNSKGEWLLQNQGFGPAINVMYNDYTNGEKTNPRSLLGILGAGQSQLVTLTGIAIDYQSLSGKKYETMVRRIRGQIQTEFHKL